MPDPTTEGMRLDQIERASREKQRADEAEKAAAEKAHARRADKADYLREKLAERAKAEDEATSGD
ncbi:MAG TPA: hypothetical protein VFN44_02735 [Solirubrobacteraceae bacterium]|nr:hypothetical protein [Solirubrobacteraceae bacterium]